MYVSGTLTPDAAGKMCRRHRIRNEGHSLPRQVDMDALSWGMDPASVEQSISNHRSVHNAIEEYHWQLDKMKADLVLRSVSF